MRRRSWFLSLVLCACLSLLLARPALVREASWPLHILHTNDHHAHLEPITTNKQYAFTFPESFMIGY